jgi:hypothetical protein
VQEEAWERECKSGWVSAAWDGGRPGVAHCIVLVASLHDAAWSKPLVGQVPAVSR